MAPSLPIADPYRSMRRSLRFASIRFDSFGALLSEVYEAGTYLDVKLLQRRVAAERERQVHGSCIGYLVGLQHPPTHAPLSDTCLVSPNKHESNARQC